MIDLTSDTEDVLHLPSGGHTKARDNSIAADTPLQDLDSDDDQPLAVLKQQLYKCSSNAALHSNSQATSATTATTNNRPTKKQVSIKTQAASTTSSKPPQTAGTSAAAGSTAGQHPHNLQAASKPVGCPASSNSQEDKENVYLDSILLGAMKDATESDCNQDDWTLQPLQRKVRHTMDQTSMNGCHRADSAAASGMSDRYNSSPQHYGPQQQQPAAELHSTGANDSSFERHAARAHGEAAAAAKPEPPSNRLSRKAAAAAATDSTYCEDDTSEAAAATARRRRRKQQQLADGDISAAVAYSGRGPGRAGGSGHGSGKIRMAADERAAQKAAEKARKEADKAAAQLARQQDAESAKAAKRFGTFASRKCNGSFMEYEPVLVMDQAIAVSALGMAIATELDQRKTTAWQVVDRLPLTGNWSGCACFCFKRRRICEFDKHAFKMADTTRVEQFEADMPPPYLQLVFEDAGAFLQHLLQDRLAGLFSAVGDAHPGCTLGVVVMGLKSHVKKLDNKHMRQGSICGFDWRRVQSQLLHLHLATPGLQLRQLTKLDEIVAHVINTARVIGQQPYSVDNQLEACGGGGPGAASKAAAPNMQADLGPATCKFAVNTLGKMSGMGGNKAWAVAKAYPSFGALISAYERSKCAGSQPSLLLQDLIEPAGTGKANPRRVGPAMSKRLHMLLTCEDPDTVVEGEADTAV